MSFVNQHQLPLILLAFLAGGTGALLLFCRGVPARAWKLADFLWICLGGFGAIAAVLAGVYAEDNSRLARQIDIAYAATRAFDRDAARFRLAHCEADHPAQGFREAIRDLCDKVKFLSASTAGNARLPLCLVAFAAPFRLGKSVVDLL